MLDAYLLPRTKGRVLERNRYGVLPHNLVSRRVLSSCQMNRCLAAEQITERLTPRACRLVTFSQSQPVRDTFQI